MAHKLNISSSLVSSFEGNHSIRVREVDGLLQILPTSRKLVGHLKEQVRPLRFYGNKIRARIESSVIEVGSRYELVKKPYGWLELVKNDEAVTDFVSFSK